MSGWHIIIQTMTREFWVRTLLSWKVKTVQLCQCEWWKMIDNLCWLITYPTLFQTHKWHLFFKDLSSSIALLFTYPKLHFMKSFREAHVMVNGALHFWQVKQYNWTSKNSRLHMMKKTVKYYVKPQALTHSKGIQTSPLYKLKINPFPEYSNWP